jgi:predicted nucleotidyltransferase
MITAHFPRIQLSGNLNYFSWILYEKNGVKRPILFGSHALGEEHPDSDIDILVDFYSGNATLDNFMQLAAEME